MLTLWRGLFFQFSVQHVGMKIRLTGTQESKAHWVTFADEGLLVHPGFFHVRTYRSDVQGFLQLVLQKSMPKPQTWVFNYILKVVLGLLWLWVSLNLVRCHILNVLLQAPTCASEIPFRPAIIMTVAFGALLSCVLMQLGSVGAGGAWASWFDVWKNGREELFLEKVRKNKFLLK